MAGFKASYVALEDCGLFDGCSFENLPDTSFWKPRLKQLFSRKYTSLWPFIGIRDSSSYVFSGPAGNGRHMTGNALIGEYPGIIQLDAGAIGCFSFRAEDFPESMPQEAVIQQVAAAFDPDDAFAYHIIIFDGFDHYNYPQAISNAIADCIGETDNSFASFCFVEDESVMSYDLLSVSTIFRLNLPSEQQRLDYIQSRIRLEKPDPAIPGQSISISLEFNGITVEEIAKETDGFSYSDLGILIQTIAICALDRVIDAQTMINMFCDAQTVRECIHLVENRAAPQTGQVISLQNPAAIVQQTEPQVPTERLAALTGKKTRTFAENLELINLVPASTNR